MPAFGFGDLDQSTVSGPDLIDGQPDERRVVGAEAQQLLDEATAVLGPENVRLSGHTVGIAEKYVVA